MAHQPRRDPPPPPESTTGTKTWVEEYIERQQRFEREIAERRVLFAPVIRDLMEMGVEMSKKPKVTVEELAEEMYVDDYREFYNSEEECRESWRKKVFIYSSSKQDYFNRARTAMRVLGYDETPTGDPPYCGPVGGPLK